MSDYLFLRLSSYFNSESDISDLKAQWVIASKSGKIEQSGQNEELITSILGKKSSQTKVVLIIPDRWVSFHLVDLPIREPKKQLQAVPYILEDRLVSDIDEMHFNIGPEVSKNKYVVSTISKNKINSIIKLFVNNFSLSPTMIVTDAMCLFNANAEADNTAKIYLDKPSNQALISHNNIIVTDLNNLHYILEQEVTNINVDIYKHEIADLNNYFKDTITKLNIKSDQDIKSWLPFLAQTWLSNHKKNKFNLAKGLVKQFDFNIVFNRKWRITAAILFITASFQFGYKILDNHLYAPKLQELDLVIKNELKKIGINNTNLELVQKELSKNISTKNQQAKNQRKDDEFFILLNEAAQNFDSEIKIQKILFQDDKLDITFDVVKNNESILELIKNKIQQNQITITDIKTDDEPMENEFKRISWRMALRDD